MKKTILITGASSGIGKATAHYFHAHDWNVVATMRRPEAETELQQLKDVLVTRLDVQDEQSIADAIQAGIEAFGHIDVLLNNAGYGLMGTFESISKDSIQRQFDVNVFGLFDVTRALLPHFRARNAGTIINVSSIGGTLTFPITSIYHATKYAVEGFSESLYYELAPLGIEVKLIEPGAIATDFGGRSLDFQHDKTLSDYNNFVDGVMAKFSSMMDPNNMSTSALVAEAIYKAATDTEARMRYLVGPDAEQWSAARKSMDDMSFINSIKTQLEI